MTCGPQCNSNFTTSFHSRRNIITALISATVLLPSGRLAAAADATADDERLMRIALDEARQGDSPFGAVIVSNGQVLALGRNLPRTNGDPTAHGEMVAIRRCLVDHGSAALRGSTLYATGEPCVMCMAVMIHKAHIQSA
jgi:tRNA(adenine34) deaminase